MSDHALFWFLFPRVVEMVMCAVSISAAALVVIKTPAVQTGGES